MADFPPIGVKEDSSAYSVTLEDKALVSETDGGYAYSRPRHGRRPRRIIATAITGIDFEKKKKVESFITTVGKYMIFKYRMPDTGEVINVRFSGSMPTARYMGYGANHSYNIADIQMTEV